MDRKMYLCQNVQPASTLSAVWKGDQVSEKWRISSRFDTNIRDPAEWAGELILMTWQARTSEFLHKMSRLGWEEINKSASTLQPSVRSQVHPLDLPSGPTGWNIICIWSAFDLDKIYQWRHSILSESQQGMEIRVFKEDSAHTELQSSCKTLLCVAAPPKC